MSFGTELQSKTSHEALLGLQDFEIKFLEHIKRCIFQRIKIDRDHSLALSSLASQIIKFDNAEFETPMSKAWLNIGREIENYSRLLHDMTDKVCAQSLDKLQQLISEKKLVRKMYQEERCRLESICKQMNEEVLSLASEYGKLVEKLEVSKAKYESNLGKGKSLKQEEARGKLMRTEIKLNLLHNEYTLLLKEANLHEKQFTTILLPALLQSQQVLQIEIVKQCQEVLLDYIRLTNTTTTDFQQIHNNNISNLMQLNYDKEYNGFVAKFRSDPLKIKFYEFLVASQFPANDIILNDVTLPALNQKKSEYSNDLLKCQHWLACKGSELEQTRGVLHSSSDKDVNLLSHLMQIHTSEALQREILERQCLEDRCLKMVEFIDDLFSQCPYGAQSLPSCFAAYPELASLPVKDLLQLESSALNPTGDSFRSTFNSLKTTMMKLKPTKKQCSVSQTSNPFANCNNIAQLNDIADGHLVGDDSKVVDDNNNNNNEDINIFGNGGTTALELNNKINLLSSSSSSSSASGGNVLSGNSFTTTTTSTTTNSFNASNKTIIKRDDNKSSDVTIPERPPRRYHANSQSIPIASPSSASLDLQHNSASSLPTSSSVPPPLSSLIATPSSAQSTSPLSPSLSSAPISLSSIISELETQEWYHGVLPREEVQKLLVEDGDFLMRCSKNRQTHEVQFVLSVMWKGQHKHFIVQGSETEGYRFEGVGYPTVQALIENHLYTREIITKRSEVVIIRPIPRATWELNNDQIELKEKIGSGQFGEVFRGLLRPTNLEVAIKTCRETLTEDLKRKFLQEGRILKQYDHPNIVKFIGIAAQRHPVMIVMEYVSGGSLLAFLRFHGANQRASALTQICVDVAAGMRYLESNNCLHRDLAARNCLIGENNIIKISDFGMSREEQEYIISGGLKQIPIKWTAPEALNFGLYTWSCDVWSYGILMWEVFSNGGNPYPGLTNSQARDEVDAGYRMPCPEKCPSNVYELMLSCWSKEPKLRPHFSQIHQQLIDMKSSLLDF